MRKRILAAIPLISILLFLIAGLYGQNWKLGWSFFFLIPLSWILLSKNAFKRANDLIPLLALMVFLWLGFGFDLWHPGWAVFLLIPIINMIVDKRITPRKMVTLSVLALYVTYGILADDWHPAWIMLLLIPIINTIFFPFDFKFAKGQQTDWKKDVSKFFKDKIIIDEEKEDNNE